MPSFVAVSPSDAGMGSDAKTSCQAHSKHQPASHGPATAAPSAGARPDATSAVPPPWRRKMGPQIANVNPAGVTGDG